MRPRVWKEHLGSERCGPCRLRPKGITWVPGSCHGHSGLAVWLWTLGKAPNSIPSSAIWGSRGTHLVAWLWYTMQ